jgi:hypothetical protein
VSVGGLDFLSAIVLTKLDLSTLAFDLVMADKSAPLLSIGQRDVHIRYGKKSAVVTLSSVLLSCLDCKDLCILHSEYPLQLPPDRLPSSLQSIWDCTAKSPEVNIDFLGSITVSLSPSTEQISEIKAAIVAHYNDVFDQSAGLRCMVGGEMFIQLQDYLVPYYVNGSRPIPFADRPEVKQLHEDYVKQGLIAPVEEATGWAAPLAILRKPMEKFESTTTTLALIALFCDPLIPLEYAVAEIDSEANFFTCFDAAKGYFQIPLHPSSKIFTTFMTPWGRFKFLRASMGLSCCHVCPATNTIAGQTWLSSIK